MSDGYQAIGGALFLCSVVLTNPALKVVVAKMKARIRTRFFDRIQTHDCSVLIMPSNTARNNWRFVFSETLPEPEKCELEVVNHSTSPLFLCWVGCDGMLFHYRRVPDSSISDGSVKCSHIEYTLSGHAFVLLKCTPGGADLPPSLGKCTADEVICVYKLLDGASRHTLRVQSTFEGYDVHTCHKPFDSEDALVPLSECVEKQYEASQVQGFAVFAEPSLLTARPDVLKCLQLDLEKVCALVPRGALERLQGVTAIYLNTSLRYGKVGTAVDGRHMCYHPRGGGDWLRSNGLDVAKAGCVEANRIDDYLESRSLWGVGGLLLHELCHAFHDQLCDGGYRCSEIVQVGDAMRFMRNADDMGQVYERAMAEGLYGAVPVHGPQGKNGPVKAYACVNCMEFWAELSVAYLCSDTMVEYNKWFPHNRQQLKDYDPQTFVVLQKLWRQYDK